MRSGRDPSYDHVAERQPAGGGVFHVSSAEDAIHPPEPDCSEGELAPDRLPLPRRKTQIYGHGSRHRSTLQPQPMQSALLDPLKETMTGTGWGQCVREDCD